MLTTKLKYISFSGMYLCLCAGGFAATLIWQPAVVTPSGTGADLVVPFGEKPPAPQLMLDGHAHPAKVSFWQE